MKSIKSIALLILGIVLIINISQGQNYKAPKIDASGMNLVKVSK